MELLKKICSEHCAPTVIIGGAFTAAVLYKLIFSGKRGVKAVSEKNWKKDVVYLYQFPRSATVPSISPFCLKLETFLRANNIAYENRFVVSSRSKYGLVPFVELNGEHFADSALIISKLRQHFNIKDLKNEHTEGVARAVDRFLDQHTFFVTLKFKMLDENAAMLNFLLPEWGCPSFLLPIVAPIMGYSLKKKISMRVKTALGNFSNEEFHNLLRQDLTAIKDILEDKQFLFGSEITYADCTVFGQLGSCFYLGIDNEVKRALINDFPTLVQYMDRIRNKLYPQDFTK